MEDSGFDSDTSKSNLKPLNSKPQHIRMFSKTETSNKSHHCGDYEESQKSNDDGGGSAEVQMFHGSPPEFSLPARPVEPSEPKNLNCSGQTEEISGGVSSTTPSTKPLPSVAKLQKRLEKHIQKARKIRQQERENTVDSQPKKLLISRNRLPVPNKSTSTPVVTKADEQPLVSWETDSEEEYEFHTTSKSASREITQQLIQDGYNLDLTPDDEDLDLIPPKPLNQRCVCCGMTYSCVVQ
ncbi:protein FAM219A [Tachypleus tridentatus]|uniref:protein FAM219A n=1 Tax=Tachypleus tridentatus TaxID=6853 RepID=UPI003FCF2CDC